MIDFIKYEVTKLSLQKALQLFSWHAFKGNESRADYGEVVDRAIAYADGHPLALKVLGSCLCHCNNKCEWRSVLDKYKKNQCEAIHEILKISFEGLDEFEKDIFLDIAFFFKGVDIDNVEAMLKSCQFYPEHSIARLIDRCLITVEYNKFQMHDLVQQMGREIVRQESPRKPKKRSRLYFDEDHEDVLKVLKKNKGLNNIQGIMLKFPEPKELQLSVKVFTMMKKLRVLIVRNAQFSGGFEYLPEELRWLDWDKYPFSLPSNFRSQKLVVLKIPYSRISLEEPLIKMSENITQMDFSHCDFIVKLPDISGMPNLKDLNVGYCKNLFEVHQLIGFHDKLVYLNLQDCPNLRIFPHSFKMKSLEVLDLSRCLRLEKFPDILSGMESLRKINLVRTAIKELPSSIEFLTRLESLQLISCKNLTYLPSCIYAFQELKFLYLSNCSKLELRWPFEERCPHLRFPMLRELFLENCNLSNLDFLTTLGCFHTLETLDLSKNNFVTIPEGICKFTILDCLMLDGCKHLQEIPRLSRNTNCVSATNCISLDLPSRSKLLSQKFYREHYASNFLPGSEIPKWFNHRNAGSSVSFWVGREFPNYASCVVFGLESEESVEFCFEECLSINGCEAFRMVYSEVYNMDSDHLWLIHYEGRTLGDLSKYVLEDSNYIEISFEMSENIGQVIIKGCGVMVECLCPNENSDCWGCVADDLDDLESNSYPQDRRLKGAMTRTSYQVLFPNDHELQPLPPDLSTCNYEMIMPGLDMGHVDSKDKGKGVLGHPVEMTNFFYSSLCRPYLEFDPKVSGGELALGSSSVVPNSNTKHSPLPRSEMDQRVSKNTGVFARPMETTLDTTLGPLGWPYMGVHSTVNVGFDLGSSSVVPYSNTEHSPLPGSEMGHRVSNNTGVLALPMETTLEATLGVQSTVNDGLDLGASSMVDPFGSIGYDDDFYGYPLQKRRRSS